MCLNVLEEPDYSKSLLISTDLGTCCRNSTNMSGTALSRDQDSENEALRRQLEEVKTLIRAPIEELERSLARKLKEIEELEQFEQQVSKEWNDIRNKINEHTEIEKVVSLDKAIEFSQSKIQALQSLLDVFAPLSNQAELAVDKVLGGGERQEILVVHEKSNIQVTRASIQCLSPGEWLNDTVIHLYLELLKERELREPGRFLKCHFFHSFFYNMLHRDNCNFDFDAVRSWTNPEKLGYSLSDCDKILVPLHRNKHWCLAVVDIRNKRLEYLDSLKGKEPPVLDILSKYIVAEAKHYNDKILDVSTWEQVFPTDIPEQLNSYDCGIFMVKYADFHSRGAPLHFTQDDIEYFRRKVVWEILNLRAT